MRLVEGHVFDANAGFAIDDAVHLVHKQKRISMRQYPLDHMNVG
jgi:hypothetical protein